MEGKDAEKTKVFKCKLVVKRENGGLWTTDELPTEGIRGRKSRFVALI